MIVLADRGIRVEHLQQAMLTAESGLDGLPNLIKEILREGMWKERKDPQSGDIWKSDSFLEFARKPLREGLGADIQTIKNLCHDDLEAIKLIDKALKGRQGTRNDLLDNVQEVKAPTGNSREAALRKLQKNNKADLIRLVEQGELSVNKAMIEAGLRSASSPLKDLKRAWKKASQAEQTEFLAWISS